MPSIMCRCGTRLRYGEIPNPIEWLAISDTNYDKFTNTAEAEQLYSEFTHILKCQNCGRLWIYCDGFGNEPTCYLPERIDLP
jgi:hypothetical protein